MGTIIGRQYSPQNGNDDRDIIHPETQIDAVLDPITGIPLRDQLSDIADKLTVININSDKPGLLSPEMLRGLSSSIENAMILSSTKPILSKGGIWFNIYDTRTSTVDEY